MLRKKKKMQPHVFTCITCNATKTNGRDFLYCGNPHCTSRVCLCNACNLEKKERWFCSNACKVSVPQQAKKGGGGTRKRSRSTSVSAAADAAAETEQKAFLFDQAKASFDTQLDLQSQLENWSKVVAGNQSTLSAMLPEVETLAKTESTQRTSVIEQGNRIKQWRAEIRQMLKDAYTNMESTEAKTFSILADMKQEYDAQTAAHAKLVQQHASSKYMLETKEKELSETQGALEKAKRLMVEKQKQLEEEKQKFEKIFRRPLVGGNENK